MEWYVHAVWYSPYAIVSLLGKATFMTVIKPSWKATFMTVIKPSWKSH